jgi:penicillin-insensitive murein endopeptidase
LTLRSAVVLAACLACSPSSSPAPGAAASPSRTDPGATDETEAETTDADAVAEAAPASSSEAESDEPEVVDDAGEDQPGPAPGDELKPRPHPLDEWSSERIRLAVKDDLGALGSISIGSPNAGALLNGRAAEGGELLTLVDAAHAFGTEETLVYLTTAIRSVHEQFADTPPLSLGHISAARGGPIRPHVSHQSGRDVDISFYYANGARWYARATEANLDLARTWSLVRALIVETDVEMILMDQQIQTYLRRYAAAKGEDPTWLAELFQGQGARRPILRHAPGHATHLHIRFYNPIAQETARRAHAALVSEHVIPELVSFVRHRAKRGDTLAKIAKKYGVSVAAIRQLNGLKNSRIRENREYRIPIRAKAPPIASEPLRFPPRRLPPDQRVANYN